MGRSSLPQRSGEAEGADCHEWDSRRDSHVSDI